MKEPKRRRMQCMSLLCWFIAIEPRRFADGTEGAVVLVSNNRVTDMRQMHANLMIATSKQDTLDKRPV